jgi:hypothetical protein
VKTGVSLLASSHIDEERPLHALFIGRETHSCRLRLHEAWSRLSVAPSHSPFKLSSSIVWVSGMMPSVESSISHEVLLRFTQFALAPRGNGGSSFRITEAVKAGAIPVYVWGGTDQAIPALPFRNRIDWSLAAIVLEDHEQILTHVIIDCYSRETITQMRSYLRNISQFFSVSGFLNAMMVDIHASSNDTANFSHRKRTARRFEHPPHPSAWILGVSVGLARWNSCSSHGNCSASSSNAIVSAMYLSFFKMFQSDNSQTSRLSFFKYFIQDSGSSCLTNFNMLQDSSTRSFIDCPFLYLSPNITNAEAKAIFCNQAAHVIFTAFRSVDNMFDYLSPSNLVRAIRIFRSCKRDSPQAAAIFSHLLHRIQHSTCNISSASFKCTEFSSHVLRSELLTANFSDTFFHELPLSIAYQEQKSLSSCRKLHIYTSIPADFHKRRVFTAFLGALQHEFHVKVVYPDLYLPSVLPLRSKCDSNSTSTAVPCIFIAFHSSSLHLYDIFQHHFGRPSELNMNDRESMFFSLRTLWFALNSSCSVIDIVDATAVSKQNIFWGFQAIVASLSLNNTVESIFTDELPVNHWELMSVTNTHHNLLQFFSAAFSSQFKHIVSTTEGPQLLSHYKDAQTALSTAIGGWPPCIIAYLPEEPCTNTTCLQSIVTLAKGCSSICNETSMVIVGDASSPLSDSALALMQKSLESHISRMFYIDSDDIFEEREDVSSIHMLSSSSCGLVSTHSSSIGTQAVLTR